MLLSVVKPGDFFEFLRITAWIALPLLGIVLLLAILQHYWRLRKLRLKGVDTAVNADDLPPDAQVLFDHSGLLNKYRKKLSVYKARYSALRGDYEKLQRSHETQLQSLNTQVMEQSSYQHAELLREINTGQQKGTKLVGDDQLLQHGEGNSAACAEALLQDRTDQVIFLQEQLERRVRAFFQEERALKELLAAADTGKAELEQQLAESNDAHASQLAQAVEELSAQTQRCEEEARLSAVRHEQVIFLESQFREIQQQNEMLNAALADEKDRVAYLEQQLEEERAKSVAAHQQLAGRHERLRNVYGVLRQMIEDEYDSGIPDESPNDAAAPFAYANMMAM